MRVVFFIFFLITVKYLVRSRARARRPWSLLRFMQGHEGLNRLLVRTIHRWTSSQAGKPIQRQEPDGNMREGGVE